MRKADNVLKHLPKEQHAGVERALRDAWATADANLTGRRLYNLASSLQAQHSATYASQREGLGETLTAQQFGLSHSLYRTLRSTNPIENLNGPLAK